MKKRVRDVRRAVKKVRDVGRRRGRGIEGCREVLMGLVMDISK